MCGFGEFIGMPFLGMLLLIGLVFFLFGRNRGFGCNNNPSSDLAEEVKKLRLEIDELKKNKK